MKNKYFYIHFADIYHEKGDILTWGYYGKVKVLKVYKKTMWRKFFIWLGFKTRLYQCKVQKYE